MQDRSSEYRAIGFGLFAGSIAALPLHLALSTDPGVATILLVVGAGLLIATIRGFLHQPAPGAQEGFVPPGRFATTVFATGLAVAISAGAVLAPNALTGAMRDTKNSTVARDAHGDSSSSDDGDQVLAELITQATFDSPLATERVVSIEITEWYARLAVLDATGQTMITYEVGESGISSAPGPAEPGARTFSWEAITVPDLTDAMDYAIDEFGMGAHDNDYDTEPTLIVTANESGEPHLTITLGKVSSASTIELAPDGSLSRSFDAGDPASALGEAYAILADAGVGSSQITEFLFQSPNEQLGPIDSVSESPLGERTGVLVTVPTGSGPRAYVSAVGRFVFSAERPPDSVPTFSLDDVTPVEVNAILNDYSASTGTTLQDAPSLSVRITVKRIKTTSVIAVEVKFRGYTSASYSIHGERLD